MRKNKPMRLASGLLVLTMLTTCIISGTFAKYTTQDSAKDTARVAKWGALVTVQGSLFDDSYKDTKETGTTATVIAYNRNTVGTNNTSATGYSAVDGDKIVAPGTKNDTGITFGLSGKPEVSSKVTYDVAATTADTNDYSNIWLADGKYGTMEKATLRVGDSLNGYYTKATASGSTTYTKQTTGTYASGDYYQYNEIVDLNSTNYKATDNRYDSTNKKYFPIEWKHKIGTATEATSVHSLTNLDAAIEAINGTGNYIYAPNTDLTAVTNSDVQITWEWPFEGKDSESKVDAVVDGADTVLGDLIAMAVNTTDAHPDVVLMAAGDASVTVISVAKGTTDSDGAKDTEVYFAKAGETKVACLTAAYNVTVTLDQVD